MRNIITSTLQRVINKTMKEFLATLVEHYIEVKGPNGFLYIYVSIRDRIVNIEIDKDYVIYKMGYEMELSLQEIVKHVLLEIKNIDLNLPTDFKAIVVD